MNDDALRKSLEALRTRSVPTLPSNFGQGVRRRIRERTPSLHTRSLLDDLTAVLFRPAFALAAVALTLGISIGAGSLSVPEDPANQSLGLEVFSHTAPTLPSTLLAGKS